RAEPELRARQRADERQALAERAAGVEVGRERNGCARVGELTGWWHRTAEEERARGQEHADDVALRERTHPVGTGRLEMVDRSRPELDRERYRARLRELVAVEAQLEAGAPARLQVPPGLVRVERASLEEDVGGLRQTRHLGQHLGDREVEIRVGR